MNSNQIKGTYSLLKNTWDKKKGRSATSGNEVENYKPISLLFPQPNQYKFFFPMKKPRSNHLLALKEKKEIEIEITEKRRDTQTQQQSYY
jgi:hypothetical protein